MMTATKPARLDLSPGGPFYGGKDLIAAIRDAYAREDALRAAIEQYRADYRTEGCPQPDCLVLHSQPCCRSGLARRARGILTMRPYRGTTPQPLPSRWSADGADDFFGDQPGPDDDDREPDDDDTRDYYGDRRNAP